MAQFLCACGGEFWEGQLAESRAIFDARATETAESYAYVRNSIASIDGAAENTKLTIVNGIVRRRELSRWTSDGGAMVLESVWAEEDATLGTHEDGAPIVDIRALYDECEMLLSQSNETVVSFFDDGILSTCGASKDRCADDCLAGFTLSSVEFIVVE